MFIEHRRTSASNLRHEQKRRHETARLASLIFSFSDGRLCGITFCYSGATRNERRHNTKIQCRHQADTRPTLDTLLERINALAEDVRRGFASVEQKLERIEIRLDRVESMALETRADFKEFRARLNETVS